VLRELADTLEKEHKSKSKGIKAGPMFIHFVKVGNNPSTGQGNTRTGILDLADDWMMEVDLNRRLNFPDIVQTSLRTDIVLWSWGKKKILIVELTVPWEDRCTQANERKRAKYEELLAECK